MTAYVHNALDEFGLINFTPVSNTTETFATGTLAELRQDGLQLRWQPSFHWRIASSTERAASFTDHDASCSLGFVRDVNEEVFRDGPHSM